jgi:hypothetical protein
VEEQRFCAASTCENEPGFNLVEGSASPLLHSPLMPKNKTNGLSSSSFDSEIRLLTWLATCVSVLSFLFYYQRGDVMLYGDAVAHINIARRVFDSLTPGPLQLGTVWLPLPHLLIMPFIISHFMWMTGVGGSIPSMVAYVFSVVGMFRLVRGILLPKAAPDAETRASASIAAWAAALIYGANPNLIYMQTTAMGEALYLAFFVWSIVYFAEFLRGDAKAFNHCGLCLTAACLTRYDGWFLAAAMSLVVVLLSFSKPPAENPIHVSRFAALKFVLIAATAPALWLAYNSMVYRNPLEFENGPYSAKAIERRTQTSTNPGHPGNGNLLVAEIYFLKSGEMNLASSPWLERLWVTVGCLALLLAAQNSLRRRFSPILFLLAPLPFYALSIAYGGVPLFVPEWWPFSCYNVRYGLQLLPAYAVALALLVYFAIRYSRWTGKLRAAVAALLFAFAVTSYAFIGRAEPLTLQEAQINMRTRNHFETQLASLLKLLPPNATLLMYLGDHVGALEQAGIPLRHVINEGNHRVWKQPRDPEGLWERALANPAQYANYVLAFEGDPVWQAVQAVQKKGNDHLRELIELHVSGQACAVLYRAQ